MSKNKIYLINNQMVLQRLKSINTSDTATHGHIPNIQ